MTLDNNIQYIIYNINTQTPQGLKTLNLNNYNEIDGVISYNEKILIFDREIFSENIKDKEEVIKSIDKSSFSCSVKIKDKLKSFLNLNKDYDFVNDKDIIIKELSQYFNSNQQPLKLYNNILKRLKFLSFSYFEKTEEEKKKTFDNSIKKRDDILKTKKLFIKKKKEEEKEQEDFLNSLSF